MVKAEQKEEFLALTTAAGMDLQPIGHMQKISNTADPLIVLS